MKQVIRKLGERKFHIFWRGDYRDVPSSNLELDFLPFIQLLDEPIGKILIHFQAKPKGLRRWGIYDFENDEYYCCNHNEVAIDSNNILLLSLDENTTRTIPTSAVILEGRLTVEDGKFYINR